MNIIEKLRIIQKMSGKTQEKLAKELGVSFVSFNSWVNGHSQPRQKKIDAIDTLFRQYTGLVSGKVGLPSTKKELIYQKSVKSKKILKHILGRVDLYDQLILSMTYNTNRIEGSTLSEDETAAIIFHNQTIANKGMTEHLEAKNHQVAVKFLFEHVADSQIDELFILKLHALLMNGIRDDAGLYRRHGVRIVGSNVPTANYMNISTLMSELSRDIRKKTDDILAHVAVIHSRFEKIHPFSDGNGRVGRLIMAGMLLQNNLPPAVIEVKEKRKYLSFLRKSQLKDDFDDLVEFVAESVLNGYGIVGDW